VTSSKNFTLVVMSTDSGARVSGERESTRLGLGF
jgi:hypothetical protein